jgi:hypothetical protein
MLKEKNPSLLILLLLKKFLPRFFFFFFFLYTAYDVKLKRFSPDLKPAVADKNFDANKNSRTPTPSGNRSSGSDPTTITTALHLPSSDEDDLVPPPHQ